MLLKIVWLLETVIFFILSYIIPKNKNLVIFWCRRWESIIWNPKIYYKYLQHNHWNSLDLFFYDKNKINTDESIRTYINTLKKYIYMLRAHYIIIDNCSFDVWLNWVFVWNFNTIQTRHGEPIKWIWFLSKQYVEARSKIVLFFEKLEYANYMMILSNYNTADIMSWVFNNSKKVKNIGVPRNDLMTHSKIQKLVENNKVKNSLSDFKNNYKQVYLLAPTFREQTNSDYFNESEIRELNEILKKKNILLLIKTHPRETRNYIKEDTSNIANVTELLPYDATDFLPFIDWIVTDYSSIYIDFLLTWKPIIWYQKDLEDYLKNERGILYPPKDVILQNSTAYNFKDLLSIFNNLNIILSTKKYISQYSSLKQKIYWENIWSTSTSEQLTKILFPKLTSWEK